jgi:hypothetical protein
MWIMDLRCLGLVLQISFFLFQGFIKLARPLLFLPKEVMVELDYVQFYIQVECVIIHNA